MERTNRRSITPLVSNDLRAARNKLHPTIFAVVVLASKLFSSNMKMSDRMCDPESLHPAFGRTRSTLEQTVSGRKQANARDDRKGAFPLLRPWVFAFKLISNVHSQN